MDAELFKAWGSLGIGGALLCVLVIGMRVAVTQISSIMADHSRERNRWQQSDQIRTRETTKALRGVAQTLQKQTEVLSTVQCANFRPQQRKVN